MTMATITMGRFILPPFHRRDRRSAAPTGPSTVNYSVRRPVPRKQTPDAGPGTGEGALDRDPGGRARPGRSVRRGAVAGGPPPDKAVTVVLDVRHGLRPVPPD